MEGGRRGLLNRSKLRIGTSKPWQVTWWPEDMFREKATARLTVFPCGTGRPSSSNTVASSKYEYVQYSRLLLDPQTHSSRAKHLTNLHLPSVTATPTSVRDSAQPHSAWHSQPIIWSALALQGWLANCCSQLRRSPSVPTHHYPTLGPHQGS